MNYLVGLTGGIGSGKSTVAGMFAELGARIVDTDLISHQLTSADGEAIDAIRASFGERYVAADGSLDREAMRTLVFANPDEKRRLEAILHPRILVQTRQQAKSPTDAPYTLIMVPLLFESGRYRDWLQRIVTVDCSEETQIAHTIQRSRLDKTAIRAIMAQQISRSERTRLADEVIHNDGSLDDLKSQVVGIHHRLSLLSMESD